MEFRVGQLNVPIWKVIGFKQRDRQHSRNLNNDTFCRLPVTNSQGIIRMKKYPDASIIRNYKDVDFFQGYYQIEEASTRDDILQPFISDRDFRSSNIRADDVGCNLSVFDIRCQQNLKASQPIKVDFKVDGLIPNDINGYALVLTNELISVRSDEQRYFELI